MRREAKYGVQKRGLEAEGEGVEEWRYEEKSKTAKGRRREGERRLQAAQSTCKCTY
jgi:hypothetical protein